MEVLTDEVAQSCPTLCDPWTVAYQVPLSMGFSRQEYWSGLPFPSPVQESESDVTQSCPTLSHPMDCSLPGSSIHGVFQARAACMSCLYILEINPLSVVSFVVIFSHSEGCLFILLIVCFLIKFN